MASILILDAMIRRADFAQSADNSISSRANSASRVRSITFENLRSDSIFVLGLRKPDFQRETNQWSVNQAISFVQSFIDGELVPSVIMWHSEEGYTFVIDGAHRLSALRSWIEDDYGDGVRSQTFFGGTIPEEQKRVARLMRSRIEASVGSYKQLTDALKARDANPDAEYPPKVIKRMQNMVSRQLDLQWVTGDANVAESSFFKINTQGTPLDKTEELLLKNRGRAVAIASRLIVRAGTGHKYWSQFGDQERKKLEALASSTNKLIFQPELSTPIRTLQLPLGGSASTLSALALLIKLLLITDTTQSKLKPTISDSEMDEDGSATVATLERCLRVISRISGNSNDSLGLHPAVYFYSDRGSNLADMFLGITFLIKKKIMNNDSVFFQGFSAKRADIETFLIANKAIIAQILVQINSRNRIDRVSDIFEYLVTSDNSLRPLNIEGVAEAARLKGSIVALREKVESKDFSDTSKSSIFLNTALKHSVKCGICGGYLEPSMSVSYDHVIRKSEGGTGDSDNGQLAHGFCNSGIKG